MRYSIDKEKKSKKEFPLVFYHFQNMRYLTEDMVNVSSGTHSQKTKDAIYPAYLKAIESARKELKKYGVTFSVKKVYSSNKLIAFLQGNVLKYKVKSLAVKLNFLIIFLLLLVFVFPLQLD